MNRSAKKIIIIAVLLVCMGALTFLFEVGDVFMGGSVPSNASQDYEKSVTTVSEAIVQADCGKSKQLLKVCEDACGEYYLFLPSMAENIEFVNLSSDVKLCVGDKKYSSKETFVATDDFRIAFEYNGASSGILNVCKSANVDAIFISSDASQEEIDAENGVKFSAECTLVALDGSILSNEELEYLRTRGNSSFYADKKPYEIKFSTDKTFYDKENASEWILLANAFDISLLKNSTVYSFAKVNNLIEAPVGDYVDLYINGDYRGNYFLCTKPMKNGQSFSVTDLEALNKKLNSKNSYEELTYGYNDAQTAYGVTNLKSYSDNTGGYLVEFTWQIEEGDIWFKTDSGATAKVRAPKNAPLEEV